jgi:CheY-like chemotaxis protein
MPRPFSNGCGGSVPTWCTLRKVAEHEERREHPDPTTPTHVSPPILLVDDPAVSHVVRKVLEAEGDYGFTTPDGATAVCPLESNSRLRLTLRDLRMPRMERLAFWLRSNGRRACAPCTGRRDLRPYPQQCRREAAVGRLYLREPVNRASRLTIVKNSCGLGRPVLRGIAYAGGRPCSASTHNPTPSTTLMMHPVVLQTEPPTQDTDKRFFPLAWVRCWQVAIRNR